MHAEHAHSQWCIFIESTLTHQGCGDGNLMALSDHAQLVVDSCGDRSTTHVQQRTVGCFDQVECCMKRSINRGCGLIKPAGHNGAWLHRHVIEQFLTHILWNINQDRSGATTGRNQERLGNDRTEIGWITHHPGMLHDRQGDAKNIGFLEGIGANGWTRHLPSDYNHGNRIHLGCCNPSDEIGGTGA